MAYRLDVKVRKAGIYLKIENKYWDKESKKSKTEHFKTLGYVHDLQKEFPNPIEHFKNEVQKMNESRNSQVSISIDMSEEIPPNTHTRYNLGYAVLLKIYHKLELDRFFNNKARHASFEYNTDAIMKLLVICRILHPSSKKNAFEQRDRYFERFDFELMHVYRALSHFSKVGMQCQKFISDQIFANYGRNTRFLYFDVTNFHFEIDEADNLRKWGKEKNNRPDPIVQMALAMDSCGILLCYKQFPGNTHDSKTFIPVFTDICLKFAPERVIAVADMGSASSDNIYFLKGGEGDKRKNGYVFSHSICKGSDDLKKFVLKETGYTGKNGVPLGDTFTYKIKSRLAVRKIMITMQSGKKKPVEIDEKQVVYWSAQYAERARMKREETIQRAMDVIANPSKYTKDTTTRDSTGYIKNIAYDKKTGEIIEQPGKILEFDNAKVAEDAKYDGYYCIVTSEWELSNEEIVKIYSGLSEIEDNFKVSKSCFGLRPVYVRLEEHINAHLLTCFISLVIMRLIQYELGGTETPEQIVECLANIGCSLEYENTYLFDYRSDISDHIGKVFNIDFNRKRLTLNKIKNILAMSKTSILR